MTIYKPKGRKTYMMDFMFKGHRVYKTTGETNKKRAENVEEAYRNALRDGARGLWSKERPHLLGTAAEEWRAKPRKNPWSKSTEAIVADTLSRVLAHFGKDRLLAEIEAEDIAQYQRYRLAEERRPSNRTVNMDVITLRKVLIHAGHWPRLRDGVHMLKERDDVGKALTPGQERQLLEECNRSVSRSLLPFVILAIDTGARYDTIRTLQWERVDLRRGIIKIGKDKTQAGTGRVVPLNARALRTLQFWATQFPDREPQHFVFPATRFGLYGRKGQIGRGGEVKAYDIDPQQPIGTIQQAWEAAKRRTQFHCPACEAGRLIEHKAAIRKRGVDKVPPQAGWVCQGCGYSADNLPVGVVGFRFHDLRHTAVSRMIVAGMPLPIIAKVVGWKLSTVVSMAERYGHFQEEDMRRAVEAISAPLPLAHANESTYADSIIGDYIQ